MALVGHHSGGQFGLPDTDWRRIYAVFTAPSDLTLAGGGKTIVRAFNKRQVFLVLWGGGAGIACAMRQTLACKTACPNTTFRLA